MKTCVVLLLLTVSFPVMALALEESTHLQFDLQGRSLYSENNFTDVKNPYQGVDSFLVAKAGLWFETSRIVGPYLELIPVHTTEDEFWWQRNVQAGVGLQVYPFALQDNRFLKAVRLFGLAAYREYYDQPDDQEAEDSDLQVGADYYFDNILVADEILTASIYLSAGYRKTNFALEDYEDFLWSGNLNVGPKFCFGGTTVFPCAVLDWTQSPGYKERWWENFARVGGALRIYPFAGHADRDEEPVFLRDLAARFQIFGEVLSNVSWLGDEAPDVVEETDIRAGIAFATGGLFRD